MTPELLCETCRDGDCTYGPTYEYDGQPYDCPKCGTFIENDYCRSHDVYFEFYCPYCDDLE